MAKVEKPLLSGNASGQIGKMLVFSRWKGIKDVRSYVVPSNPNTPKQQTQRSVMKSAVEAYGDADFYTDDVQALNISAGRESKPMSGFNYFVKRYISIKNAGGVPVICSYAGASIQNQNLVISFDLSGNAACKLAVGTAAGKVLDYKDLTVTEKTSAEGIFTHTGSVSLPASGMEDFDYLWFWVVSSGADEHICGYYKQGLPPEG